MVVGGDNNMAIVDGQGDNVDTFYTLSVSVFQWRDDTIRFDIIIHMDDSFHLMIFSLN